MGARTDTLWDWTNAYSHTGGPVPVNLPVDVTNVRIVESDNSETPAVILQNIDHYIRELTLKDEHPDALGTLQLASIEPLVAGSWSTVEQTYTVGSMPMKPGGAFMIGKQLSLGPESFQNEDPSAPWYVSIQCSNPGIRFEKITRPLGGMHGNRFNTPAATFQLEGADLRAGETVRVVYGDTSGGSAGFRVQESTTDELMFPLYVDLEGKENFLTPSWPSLEVIGAKVHGVHGFVPSVVETGEVFEMSVRSEDLYLNRASGAIPGYEVFLRGKPVQQIPAGEKAIHVISDIKIETAGVYRFAIRSADGKVEGSSNPVWVRKDPPFRVYWGETHGHTAFAEGQGSAEGYFRFGLEDSRLDFLTLSEHDVWLDDSEWQTLQELARKYYQEGRFIPFLGFEWTMGRARGGHHNVLFRTPGRNRVGGQDANRLPELYAGLHRENDPADVLIIPHAHQSGDWTQNDPELEKLIEIYSMHGSFEWFGNMYLKNGFEVGFIAASDTHQSKPGYNHGMFFASRLGQVSGLAAVIAPEKTGDAIFDALRRLSAYATSGQRIILDARLNGAATGTRQPFTTERAITCRAMGTSPIDRIEVVKNGSVIYGQNYLSAPLASRAWVQVSFESSSEVFEGQQGNPRPYRQWVGTLDITGASVRSIQTPGFDNRYFEFARIDSEVTNRIHFHVETRGRGDTMLLELEGASAGTVLRFQLEPRKELKFSGPLVRPPRDLPGADGRLRLAELQAGRAAHEFQVDDHIDAIRIQAIDPTRPMDREFEFTDLEAPEAGDYYYVRVTQLDGGRAWSSPFWVGAQSND